MKTSIIFLFILGGSLSGGGGSSTDIFQLDPNTEEWIPYGNMRVRRQKHAVELVNYADFGTYCQPKTGEFPSTVCKKECNIFLQPLTGTQSYQIQWRTLNFATSAGAMNRFAPTKVAKFNVRHCIS